MYRTFLLLGSINAFLSVVLGAFGAHGLKEEISRKMLEVYETGVHYHMMHALGILVIAVISERLGHASLVKWSGWLLFAGIVLFSGSLYILSTTGILWLGAITPLGGTAFLAGWIFLAVAVFRIKKD